MTIDMGDIVLDPDLGQGGPLKIARAARSVDENGLTVIMPYTPVANVFGIVTPAGSRQLNRLPEADRASGAISVITTVPLNIGGNVTAPDMICYEGKYYIVAQVDDWAGYGYTSCIATLTNMQGPDPWAMNGV